MTENQTQQEVSTSQSQLTDITRGLHHAAASTHDMVANQYITMLNQFFDKNKDGTYTAKRVVIHLPDNKMVEVPLISLVSPKGLTLDEMIVKLSVRLSESEIKTVAKDFSSTNITRTSFKAELSPLNKNGEGQDSSLVNIEIRFKSNEPPEGLMRMLDQFSQLVVPLKSLGAEGYKKIPKWADDAKDTITTALNNKNILDALATMGYTYEKLKEVLQKCREVNTLERDCNLLSLTIKQEQKKVDEIFQRTFFIARIAFSENKNEYEALNLDRKISNNTREWAKQASDFYEAFRNENVTISAMENFKYDKDKILNEYKSIENINALLEELDKKKSDTKIKELKDWVDNFRAVAKIVLSDRQLIGIVPESDII